VKDLAASKYIINRICYVKTVKLRSYLLWRSGTGAAYSAGCSSGEVAAWGPGGGGADGRTSLAGNVEVGGDRGDEMAEADVGDEPPVTEREAGLRVGPAAATGALEIGLLEQAGCRKRSSVRREHQ
jgi:hypothetical protein